MHTLEDVIYLAGLVDGEGCIRISAGETSAGERRSYALSLSVTNTDESVIRWAHKTFARGSVGTYKPSNPKYARKWTWLICSKAAAEVISMIRPYLKIKRPESDVALAFDKLTDQCKQGDRNFSASFIPEKELYYQRLIEAKKAYKKYE